MMPHLPRLRSLLNWRKLRWVLGAATVPAILWACNSHPLEAPVPTPETQTDYIREANPIRQLDLLFLVDNSHSMAEEQTNLSRNFPDFMRQLEMIPGGVPDVRIAVTSSNFGAGPNTPAAECPPYGDRGAFLTKQGCGLTPNTSAWLCQGASCPGGKNFTGDLPTVFGCMAGIGVNGCGYEHQLQAIRAALSDVNPQNRGFIRENAFLAIVMLTDEDDCSAEPGAAIFDAIDPMGRSGSFRCNMLGHVCNNMPVPASDFSAPLASCKPFERRDDNDGKLNRLINVSEFVDYVRGLKPGRPDRILVSAIMGWDDNAGATYRVGQIMKNDVRGMITELDVAPICSTPMTGVAAPGVRIKSFLDGFGENGKWYSICNADLKSAMESIGRELALRLVETCITSPIVDTDLNKPNIQADCSVFDRRPKQGSSGYNDVPIPSCESGAQMPCWELTPDPMCGGSGFRVTVKRAGPPPPGTLESVKCLTCTSSRPNDPRCATAR